MRRSEWAAMLTAGSSFGISLLTAGFLRLALWAVAIGSAAMLVYSKIWESGEDDVEKTRKRIVEKEGRRIMGDLQQQIAALTKDLGDYLRSQTTPEISGHDYLRRARDIRDTALRLDIQSGSLEEATSASLLTPDVAQKAMYGLDEVASLLTVHSAGHGHAVVNIELERDDDE